jgi:hypothetical protein
MLGADAMIHIDAKEVEAALLRKDVQLGVTKYVEIMERARKTNVSTDLGFQKLFNGFYIIRQRPARFYERYYDFMESHKRNISTFEEAVTHFYKEFGSIEASFSSKLVATLNPSMPIWDSMVMKTLGYQYPSYTCANRLQQTIYVYYQIVGWYREFIKTDNARELLQIFDKCFPCMEITDTKKIDFVIWAVGKNSLG